MRFTPESLVVVHVSVRRPEGDETIVGRSDTGVFLVIPTQALDILDELAAGKTVGQAQATFEERYGERPDLEEFLGHLEDKGLVALANSDAKPSQALPAPRPLRFHFSTFPEALARRLFGRTSLTLCLGLITLALFAFLIDPGVIPDLQALYFNESVSLTLLVLASFYYATLLLHEMAHLVAARAVGVNSRLGIGHRLWVLVAETDMSGLWAVPREKRYLPLLAGPLVDATLASLLVISLFGSRHGWWTIADSGLAILRALLLIYLLGLLWQCFLFVRTDLYFVLSNFFGCKNLLGDTEAFLRFSLGRALPFLPRRDPPQIPDRELRVVRFYAGIWLLGRALALGTLILIYIPLTLHYVVSFATTLATGPYPDSYAFFDALLTATIVLVPAFAGFWLWIRSLAASSRKRPLNAS